MFFGNEELLRVVQGGATMKFNTALLFLFSDIVLLLISYEKRGNRRTLILPLTILILLISGLPFLLIFPPVLSLGLQALNKSNYINTDFGLALYTIILISIGVILMLFYARNLNQTDNIRSELEKSALALHQELLDYKLAIDQVLLVSITDSSGSIFT